MSPRKASLPPRVKAAQALAKKSEPAAKKAVKRHRKDKPVVDKGKGYGAWGGTRPTLTPELHREIVEYLREGCYKTTAAWCAGIEPMLLWRWLAMGKDAESGIYYEFYRDVKRAECLPEREAIIELRTDPKKEWKALAFWLERRHRRKWGVKMQVDSNIQITKDPEEDRSIEDLEYFALHGEYPEQAPKPKR